jgi:hypothetical protein
MHLCRRRSRRLALVSPLLGLLALTGLWRFQDAGQYNRPNSVRFPCLYLPGIDNITVVLKTGVTEALQKIPIHFQTTLHCIPDYVIISDFEEDIEGVHVHDVLRHVDNEIKQNNPDFDLYNRVRAFGRDGLTAADTLQEANGPTGMPNNPGWKLDKWKFLPMIDELLQLRPDAAWYVFAEADTYLVWPNLAAWLSRLDSSIPYYLGTETQIGNVVFAHGGSGFILSNRAMRMVSDFRTTRVAELDRLVDRHWAGDCVLGKVLADAGVGLTYSWPMLQNARLGETESLNEVFYRYPWCYPVIDFHHLTVDEIWELFRFDQDWFLKVSFPTTTKPTQVEAELSDCWPTRRLTGRTEQATPPAPSA